MNVTGTLNFLASAGPYARTTVKLDELDEIMHTTGGELMARGHLYNIVPYRLSPNVYRLSLKLANP